MPAGREMDIYDADGNLIAHLLHFIPEAAQGGIILVKTGKEFGLTEAERAKLSDTIHKAANRRAKVVVVDESTTVEETTAADLRARRLT